VKAARAPLASAAAYVVLTCVAGRDVLASLGSAIASDPGDPILNAAILAWNAVHVPWTDAWYQFPIFHPTRDALVLSEHLSGVSIIATPIYRATGNALTAYNLTLLLSYPLSGLAMYALAWHLTRSAAAAFLAGLAFAFAPYRASQLPHIQLLIVFWAPLALLGLHRFVDSGRRRWLVLFGAAWMLQGASNGYFLVFFSVLTGLWVLWFVVLRRRWRDLGWIAAATAVSALPLAPILHRYLVRQRELGLSRNLGEISAFSADIAAPLCAPPALTFWGWLRVACAQEGELFAGAALIALCVAGGLYLRATHGDERRTRAAEGSPGSVDATWTRRPLVRAVRRIAIGLAALYLAIAATILVAGPWRIDLGPLRASASSVDKPLSVALLFLLIAAIVSARVQRVVARGSTHAFYLGAAATCWVMTWGPFPRLLGGDVLYQAPYAWLIQLPGAGGLRVPARFWMMALLCLVVFMSLAAGAWLRRRQGRAPALLVAAAALALAADGWTTMATATMPAAPAVAAALRGRTVLVLPAGELDGDVAAVYQAVGGGWRTVNGFSGYEPGYYEALRTLSARRDPALFEPFRADGELDVLVADGDRATLALVAGQIGAQLIRRRDGVIHYRLPPRPVAPVTRVAAVPGARVPIRALAASCSPEGTALAVDGDIETRWVCGSQLADHEVTADLGLPARVAAVTHALGTNGADFPRELTVETSLDGTSWQHAWTGSPAALVLGAALAEPRITRIVLPFAAREARYVRLRQTGRHERNYWSIAELEVLAGR
jgi:hypothetical protein